MQPIPEALALLFSYLSWHLSMRKAIEGSGLKKNSPKHLFQQNQLLFMFSIKTQYWNQCAGLAEGQVMSLLRVCLTLHAKRRMKENVKY